MIPAPFKYQRPRTLDEAITLLAEYGDDAKILAGGHSLIPAMKLRLAQPKVLVDLAGIGDLNYIREEQNAIAIGALTTHFEIESSTLLAGKSPLLTELAPQIGDVQVRNKGTIGGSLVHADPAADWPAAILALDAQLLIAGPDGGRVVSAGDFFVDMLQTTVKPNEILSEIRVPVTGQSVAYVKFAQKASGFAIAGVAAVIDEKQKDVRVGITGVAPKPYRARAVEQALRAGEEFPAASQKAAAGIEPLSDIHASAEFRAHLARVNTQRALERAATHH
jgi:carbon-monoxide dehydrogenase medium subunit